MEEQRNVRSTQAGARRVRAKVSDRWTTPREVPNFQKVATVKACVSYTSRKRLCPAITTLTWLHARRAKSPYTLSYAGQVKLCLTRGFQRLRGDPSLTLTALFGNFMMALIISSIFYNMPETTSSFYQRGALLFFAILLNAFSSALEVYRVLFHTLPIVVLTRDPDSDIVCPTPYR
jgi:hypothetical protein